MKILIVLCLVAIFCTATTLGSGKNIVCYFASWTVYRPGDGSFDVRNIDPSLCTHINFAFIGLNEDASIKILDPWESNDPSGYGGFKNLVALKKSNPDLKISVSMGGWNEGSEIYSKVASDAMKRKLFANHVLRFIKEWDFDGFDLDWEYPGLRGGDSTIDKDDFTALLKELSNVLKPKGYLLSIAGAGAIEKIDEAYDIPAITKLIDMINVMVFDFHGAFDDYVGHVSPLYPAKVDYDYYDNSTYNVDVGIQHWLESGADPAKINLGVILYGRSFTLADRDNTTLYAPVKGGGRVGPYTQQSGYLGYNEICKYYTDSTYVWDEEQRVPHRYWGDQWVGFEDEKSLTEKVNYALENNLGGIMVWSLDYDDFRGACGDKYPLLKTINKINN
ncbi:acidic mammalian chitinase [Diabrotica virgifera virgifera]|uniref:GH18 domain-containing protein n=1 Tax=Diabrotica virgifera virgifera TaxID=50390 RepID=A0ABM5IS15_DIAVI|nr:acidic mammalian chitinase [Diabrotica virgifera virgifera]